MTDIIDVANERAEDFLRESLSRIPHSGGVSATHCEDCGDPIPEARRLAVPGCTLCVLCQTYLEKGWP